MNRVEGIGMRKGFFLCGLLFKLYVKEICFMFKLIDDKLCIIFLEENKIENCNCM